MFFNSIFVGWMYWCEATGKAHYTSRYNYQLLRYADQRKQRLWIWFWDIKSEWFKSVPYTVLEKSSTSTKELIDEKLSHPPRDVKNARLYLLVNYKCRVKFWTMLWILKLDLVALTKGIGSHTVYSLCAGLLPCLGPWNKQLSTADHCTRVS